MNDSWPTMTTAMIPPHKMPEEVSSADLNALLRGRKFGQPVDNTAQFDMCPPTEQYDPAELSELEEFCRKHGIIGINIGKSPRQTLAMLKGRMGIREQTVKRGLLNG